MSSLISEKDAENFIITIIKGIFSFFYCIIFGFSELKKKPAAIIFSIAVLIPPSMLAYDRFIGNIEKKYILISITLPVLVLLVLGAARKQHQFRYQKDFLDAGFKGKDGRTPGFISLKEDNGKSIMYFKSNIPLDTWKKNTGLLQTALDCNILSVEQGNSKKITKLTTVSTGYKLPTNILWNDSKISDKESVIIIGENALEPIKFDLNQAAHVLAAGETGSGKSVILRLMLWQLAKKGAVIFMLDFKGGVEFGIRYENYGEVITERVKAVELLEALVKETEERLAKFRSMEVKNIKEYYERTGEKLSRIGIFCDEIGEMLDQKGATKEEKEIMGKLTGYLSTIARLGRAPGVNLFLGVQRPDANVLTGQIKNNIPVRVCGRFADKAASEIVLGNTAACNLSEIKGRFMYKVGADTVEFQAYYFDDDTMLGSVDNMEHRVMNPQLEKRLVGINPEYRQYKSELSAKDSPPARPSAPAARAKRQKKPPELFVYDDYEEELRG